MQVHELICINCPMGCRLTVTLNNNGGVAAIGGNQCKKGQTYAQQEAVAPQRVLTLLMRAKDRSHPFSVKSAAPLPKNELLNCAAYIRSHKASAPIHCGDVVIQDICHTGVSILATQDLP